MSTRTGTSHFVSRQAAMRNYRKFQGANCSAATAYELVDDKLANGEIHLGRPAVQPGETLELCDEGTRYCIVSES